ncbi:Nrap domain-containing protein, partial [Cephalotus follicularis]
AFLSLSLPPFSPAISSVKPYSAVAIKTELCPRFSSQYRYHGTKKVQKKKTMDSLIEAHTDPVNFKVNSLLKEVQLDYSPAFTNLVEGTVSLIKRAIDQIPDDLQVSADLAPGFVSDVGADKVEFGFKKPKSIEIGGSYSIQCVVKPDVNVDLFVRLPKECFHEKDYLNYRYHAKRCLYLCVIKKYLIASKSFEKIEWSFFQNEARKPVLIVYPAIRPADFAGLFIRIIPTATSLFHVSKLSLRRNNIHSLNQGNPPEPTPKYNSSILEDMFLEDNAEFVKRTFSEREELRNALILLKVWARQRGSLYLHDCLNGFLITIILSYLATRDKIDKNMKAIQIFRSTLVFIANSELWNRGLYFRLQDQNRISMEERLQFKKLFPVVVSDSSTHVNLAFRISSIGVLELQDEAASTLKCIEKFKDGGFEEIFMTKIDYPAKYDYFIRLNLKARSEVHALGFCLDDECWRLYEQKVHGLLNQGLTDRAKFIRVIWKNTHTECSIENALKFRKFWGEKAELRRFKDGRIAESTVWESEQWTKHLVLKKIIEHVLVRHLALLEENIVQIVDQLDFSLLCGVGDPICFSGSLLEAFDVLSKRLRLIEDIPLRVSSVQPLDSAFRFTSVFPPQPHPLANEKVNRQRLGQFVPSCIQPLQVMIQLEGSGNWPMDEVAIEKTKSAFLIKIGESLQNRWGMTCTATEDDMDIFISGYAFRLKILHERGLTFSKREVGSDQVKRVSSTDKTLFVRSQHASMIHGLQGRFPIYGPVVRLAKRWVASHLFSACLVEEAVEILVAHLFVKHLPFGAPCSRITGFLRFLRLIAEYDWMFSPFIVDINNDLSSNDLKEINDNFMLNRKAYEENAQNISAAMFLATTYDKASEAWTRYSPNALEVRRLVAYARSSANLLTKLIVQHQNDSYRWECLFRTPLNNFDAVILLHRNKLPSPQRLLFTSELNQAGRRVAHGNAGNAFCPFMLPGDLKGDLKELKNKLLVNFDPLRFFVEDVEKEFAGMMQLWYDSLGGDAIGITWERLCSKKRGREEADEERKDLGAVLRVVGELGKGFVRDVYFLKTPRFMS